MEVLVPKLPLAVDIADVAAKADAVHEPLDVEMMARRLKEEHPEADVRGERLRNHSVPPAIADRIEERSAFEFPNSPNSFCDRGTGRAA